MKNSFFALAFLAVGCGHHAAVAPVAASVGAPGGVRIELRQVTANILKFLVFNDTNENMVLDREQVYLHTPNGDLQRIPGGAMAQYNVPAGGFHDLNVRFDFEGIPEGTALQVHFEKALTAKGQPVNVEPFAVTRQ